MSRGDMPDTRRFARYLDGSNGGKKKEERKKKEKGNKYFGPPSVFFCFLFFFFFQKEKVRVGIKVRVDNVVKAHLPAGIH
jgi:hypothetical protein